MAKMIVNWIYKPLKISTLRNWLRGYECRGFEPHIPPFRHPLGCLFLYIGCWGHASFMGDYSRYELINKFPFPTCYNPPLVPSKLPIYKKNRWMCGLLNPGSCSLRSLRSALGAVQAPENSAILPNGIMPNRGTNYYQTAEQNYVKLRKSFKNICTYQLFLLPLHRLLISKPFSYSGQPF